jgi:hypothetical protein
MGGGGGVLSPKAQSFHSASYAKREKEITYPESSSGSSYELHMEQLF